MAKFKIAHSCGHEQERSIGGPIANRKRIADHIAEGPCSACERVERQEKNERDAERCAWLASEEGLPALHGTEAQITWAETIRRETIDKIQPFVDKALARAEAQRERNPAIAAFERRIKAGMVALKGHADAVWWIDIARNMFHEDLFLKICVPAEDPGEPSPRCDTCGDEGGQVGEPCGRDLSEEHDLPEGSKICAGKYA